MAESGEVYAWGDGRQGQIGHSESYNVVDKGPELVKALDGVFVVQVACGRFHTLALTGELVFPTRPPLHG